MRKTLFNLMSFLAFGVAAYAFAFFAIMDENHVIFKKFIEHGFFGYAHVWGGAVALALGPLQLSTKLRQRSLMLHRRPGKLYLASVLFGATGGLYMAVIAEGGHIAHTGFGLLGLGWLVTTAQSYLCIIKRNIRAHQIWMIRSYALTYAAVALRIYLPLFDLLSEMPFDISYPLIAWLCWVPNLFVAELVIRKWPVQLDVST